MIGHAVNKNAQNWVKRTFYPIIYIICIQKKKKHYFENLKYFLDLETDKKTFLSGSLLANSRNCIASNQQWSYHNWSSLFPVLSAVTENSIFKSIYEEL